MKLIVGLGNPGRRYEQTRHNIGFMVASEVAKRFGSVSVKHRFDGEVAEGIAEGSSGDKLVVLCPQTYMNASGKSVRKACDFYKLSPDQILVVCDDLDLPVGRLRFRASGSAGGQKGLADIIRHLGTEQVARLRIGIGRPPTTWDPSDYVLGKFAAEEQEQIDKTIELAAQAAVDWSNQGIGYVMNRYNADPAPKRKSQQRIKGKDSATSTAEPADDRANRPHGDESEDESSGTVR